MLSHFGVGVGTYFLQILLLGFTCLVALIVLSFSMDAYKRRGIQFDNIRHDTYNVMNTILQTTGLN